MNDLIPRNFDLLSHLSQVVTSNAKEARISPDKAVRIAGAILDISGNHPNAVFEVNHQGNSNWGDQSCTLSLPQGSLEIPNFSRAILNDVWGEFRTYHHKKSTRGLVFVSSTYQIPGAHLNEVFKKLDNLFRAMGDRKGLWATAFRRVSWDFFVAANAWDKPKCWMASQEARALTLAKAASQIESKLYGEFPEYYIARPTQEAKEVHLQKIANDQEGFIHLTPEIREALWEILTLTPFTTSNFLAKMFSLHCNKRTPCPSPFTSQRGPYGVQVNIKDSSAFISKNIMISPSTFESLYTNNKAALDAWAKV